MLIVQPMQGLVIKLGLATLVPLTWMNAEPMTGRVAATAWSWLLISRVLLEHAEGILSRQLIGVWYWKQY